MKIDILDIGKEKNRITTIYHFLFASLFINPNLMLFIYIKQFY